MENSELINMLEEEAMHVSYQMSTPIRVSDAGISDKDMLERAKRNFIGHTIGVWKDQLVKTAEGYPQSETMEVDVVFDIDAVILNRTTFDALKSALEGGEDLFNDIDSN